MSLIHNIVSGNYNALQVQFDKLQEGKSTTIRLKDYEGAGTSYDVTIKQLKNGNRELIVGNEKIIFSKADAAQDLIYKPIVSLGSQGSSSPKFERTRTNAHIATSKTMTQKNTPQTSESPISSIVEKHADRINGYINGLDQKLNEGNPVLSNVFFATASNDQKVKINIKQSEDGRRVFIFGDKSIELEQGDRAENLPAKFALMEQQELAKAKLRTELRTKDSQARSAAGPVASGCQEWIDQIQSTLDSNSATRAATYKELEENHDNIQKSGILDEYYKVLNNVERTNNALGTISTIFKEYRDLSSQIAAGGMDKMASALALQELSTNAEEKLKKVLDRIQTWDENEHSASMIGYAIQCQEALEYYQATLSEATKYSELEAKDLTNFCKKNTKTAIKLINQLGEKHKDSERYREIKECFSDLQGNISKIGGKMIFNVNDLSQEIKEGVNKIENNLKALLTSSKDRNIPGEKLFLQNTLANYTAALRALQTACQNIDTTDRLDFDQEDLNDLENTENAISDALSQLDKLSQKIDLTPKVPQYASEENSGTDNELEKGEEPNDKNKVKHKRKHHHHHHQKKVSNQTSSSASITKNTLSDLQRARLAMPAPKGLPAAQIAVQNALNFTERQLSEFESQKGFIDNARHDLGLAKLRKQSPLVAQNKLAEAFGVKLNASDSADARQAQLDPYLQNYEHSTSLSVALGSLTTGLRGLANDNTNIEEFVDFYLPDEMIKNVKDAVAYFSQQNPVPEGLKDFVDNWNQAIDQILPFAEETLPITSNLSVERYNKIKAAKIDPSILD